MGKNAASPPPKKNLLKCEFLLLEKVQNKIATVGAEEHLNA